MVTTRSCSRAGRSLESCKRGGNAGFCSAAGRTLKACDYNVDRRRRPNHPRRQRGPGNLYDFQNQNGRNVRPNLGFGGFPALQQPQYPQIGYQPPAVHDVNYVPNIAADILAIQNDYAAPNANNPNNLPQLPPDIFQLIQDYAYMDENFLPQPPPIPYPREPNPVNFQQYNPHFNNGQFPPGDPRNQQFPPPPPGFIWLVTDDPTTGIGTAILVPDPVSTNAGRA